MPVVYGETETKAREAWNDQLGVALALQSKDDSAALEIGRLKAELVEAQSEIAARRVGWHKTAFGDGWVFAKQEDRTDG